MVEIPDKDHVARFCRPMQVLEGEVQATAFMLRSGENSLSVNWMDFFNHSNRENEIAELQLNYAKTFRVGKRAKIAVLNVGEVIEKVLIESHDNRKLKVLHDPINNDLSHSGIYNLKEDDEMIAELILETVRDSYSARE
ncbi:MAG: hypothetical protein KAH23_09595 [Kiritimatiellae bacterium]|nr:hypothetical protein [Kiritimatiellia bacterium]